MLTLYSISGSHIKHAAGTARGPLVLGEEP